METFLSLRFLDPVTLAHNLVSSKRQDKADIDLAAVNGQAASVRMNLE